MKKIIMRTLKKEMRKMTKISAVLLVIFMAVVFCYASAEAATDRTVSVAATGSVTGVTSLSISPTTVTYATTTADAYPTTPTTKKVVITYTSNYNPWKMMVYTNNTQVLNRVGDTTGYGMYAKGGLATADGHSVVPCKWVAKTGTNVTVPAVPTTASLHNFVKDKRDEDDPSTPVDNESWASALAGGYPNIAYGGPVGGFCVDPTNTASGPTQYQGDAISGSVSLYIAAGWGTSYFTPATPAGAGAYGTNFVIELYHE